MSLKLEFLYIYRHAGTVAILKNDIMIKYAFPKVLVTPIKQYFFLNAIFWIYISVLLLHASDKFMIAIPISRPLINIKRA